MPAISGRCVGRVLTRPGSGWPVARLPPRSLGAPNFIARRFFGRKLKIWLVEQAENLAEKNRETDKENAQKMEEWRRTGDKRYQIIKRFDEMNNEALESLKNLKKELQDEEEEEKRKNLEQLLIQSQKTRTGTATKSESSIAQSSVEENTNSSNNKSKVGLNLPALDSKWQAYWETRRLIGELQNSRDGAEEDMPTSKTLGVEDSQKKMYILPMFPYPSGDLHLGHLRVYTISDVLSRFRRMQGYNVLHPIGWDAFGLPAENAAIERGIDPSTWTKQNIQKMKSQLKLMNGQWDWDKEFATSDPEFYGFTQFLFLALFNRNLAYQKESLVNYDPVDKTVLANEQVDAKGYSWRSGAKVEKKMLKQWFLRITDYQDALLNDLKKLQKDEAWPQRVLAMQKNWLGKSSGAQIEFPLVVYGKEISTPLKAFTTRPDTLLGVQYIALAPTHALVQSISKTEPDVRKFLDDMPTFPQDSKLGYLLPNVHALNPLASKESIPAANISPLPIYIAPYVLSDYADGVVMGVPGHDARDFAFWKQNRSDEPIRYVISSSPDESTSILRTGPFVHHGYLNSNNGPFSGLATADAHRKIVSFLADKGLGKAEQTWRLRDWLISRQRYWGTPIPIIHCGACGPVPVSVDDLPVELPPMEEHWAKGRTGNPLEQAHDWINTPCPRCGAAAKRDTDTMDTFVDSSWYFMRFIDPKNKKLPFSIEKYRTWLPVDLYVGGVEHAILHLLYARFFSKFMSQETGCVEPQYQEPFKRLLTQGMVHGKTYSDATTGKFLKPNEVDLSNPNIPIVVATGQPAAISFEKMSKSKYNGVDPGTCISKYGADATRAHILFQAPVSEVLEWDEDKIPGVTRWLHRLHEFVEANHQLINSVMTAHPNPKEFLLKMQLASLGSVNVLGRVKDQSNDATGLPPFVPLGKEQIENVLTADKKIWRATQGTINRVTIALGETYSLNTVVSDLMALTNIIIDDSTKVKPPGAYSVAVPHAVAALIKMMAPITPAFSEECWELINTPNPKSALATLVSDMRTAFASSTPQAVGSVFDQAFPEEDGTYDMLAPEIMKCAVQVNGKLKAAFDIPIPEANLKGKELEDWLLEQILATNEGQKKFGPTPTKNGADLTKAKKVFVVQGGKTINFVI